MQNAILSTFIKLPFVIKIFVLSIFEWPFYAAFTVDFCCRPTLHVITNLQLVLQWRTSNRTTVPTIVLT